MTEQLIDDRIFQNTGKYNTSIKLTEEDKKILKLQNDKLMKKCEELAKLIKEVVGYKGQINFDTTKPEGTPRKLLDSKVINSLGWSPKFDLRNGLIKTYEYFLSQ